MEPFGIISDELNPMLTPLRAVRVVQDLDTIKYFFEDKITELRARSNSRCRVIDDFDALLAFKNGFISREQALIVYREGDDSYLSNLARISRTLVAVNYLFKDDPDQTGFRLGDQADRQALGEMLIYFKSTKEPQIRFTVEAHDLHILTPSRSHEFILPRFFLSGVSLMVKDPTYKEHLLKAIITEHGVMHGIFSMILSGHSEEYIFNFFGKYASTFRRLGLVPSSSDRSLLTLLTRHLVLCGRDGLYFRFSNDHLISTRNLLERSRWGDQNSLVRLYGDTLQQEMQVSPVAVFPKVSDEELGFSNNYKANKGLFVSAQISEAFFLARQNAKGPFKLLKFVTH
jgi:hypothetical protein